MIGHYLKKYPLSLLIVAVVLYLSFFKPPQTDMATVAGLDKVVHGGMYFGLSGMLWLEFLRAHGTQKVSRARAWLGAFVCPVLFSGMVELLQSCCTTYRGGEWWDLVANATGALLASWIGYGLLKKKLR